MNEGKVYNVCLQRVKFQVVQAKRCLNGKVPSRGRVILESYNTGDIGDIVDILELYDLQDKTSEGLRDELDDLAYTVSILVKEKLEFAFDEMGNLGLYLLLKNADEASNPDTEMAATAFRERD